MLMAQGSPTGVYEMSTKTNAQILAVITEMLNKGIVPWRKPWTGAKPRNADGRAYTGINHILLSCSGYELPRWLTYNKARALGGNVKQGEKGTHVIYFNMFDTIDKTTGKKLSVPVLKLYTVFNESQCEGIKLPELSAPKIVEAESIVQGYKDCPTIKYGYSVAAYQPSTDTVMMPSAHQFESTDKYYSTQFHELTHSTGSKDRLNRDGITKMDFFGTSQYSFEELIAEFGSAFLCSESGIDNTLEHSAAYIDGWLNAFSKDPSMLVKAASKAQKAADYILGTQSAELV
jgi:antirestriction protein ArdC